MKMNVRRLNSHGLRVFNEFVKSEDALKKAAPHSILADDRYTEVLGTDFHVVYDDFKNQYDFGQHLNEVIPQSIARRYSADKGFWNWLSLFYLDLIWPRGSKGVRAKREAARFQFSPESHYKAHRHLVRMPFMFYRDHGEYSRLFLYRKPNILPDVVEQVFSNQKIMGCHQLVQACCELYYDAENCKPKRGSVATDKRKPGTLRRFIKVAKQVEMNYDFKSMTCEEVLCSLPSEFDRWL